MIGTVDAVCIDCFQIVQSHPVAPDTNVSTGTVERLPQLQGEPHPGSLVVDRTDPLILPLVRTKGLLPGSDPKEYEEIVTALDLTVALEVAVCRTEIEVSPGVSDPCDSVVGRVKAVST